MTIRIDNIVDGIFLFILIGFSNYIYRIIPNQLEKFIFSHIFAQHLLILLLINFSVELVDNTNQSPLDNFFNSLVIYGFYIVFSKCGTWVSIILTLLLAVMFYLTSERTYKGDPDGYLEDEIRIIAYVSCGILGVSAIWTLYNGYRKNPSFNPVYFYLNITDNQEDYKDTKIDPSKTIDKINEKNI